MKHFFILFFAISVILSACQETPEQKLVALDKAFGGAEVADQAKAKEFIAIAEQYGTQIKAKDPNKYIDLMLKSAGLAINIEQYQKALDLYSNVADGFKDHPKAPTAMFMIGFVYENNLGDLAKARNAYEVFLKKYPNDPDFKDDAEMALKHLGKTPEQIIQEFSQQQPAQQ